MNRIRPEDLADFDAINRELDKAISKFEKFGNQLADALSDVKKEAAGLHDASKDLNTSTEKGRAETEKAAKAADKLTDSYKSLAEEALENQRAIDEVRQAKKLLGDISKNQVRLNNAEEGSYNALAAQYNLIKITLNAMGKEQRETTKEGRDMVKTANEIYQEMKRLQAETGKNVLNVGNYSEALQGATNNLNLMRRELHELRGMSFTGKTQEEIEGINRRIGELMSSINDLRAEQAAYGQDTASLVTGSLKFFAAGIEGIVASTKLLGIESPVIEKLQNSIVELIAVTQALSEIEEVLQKKTLQSTATRIRDIAINIKDTVTKWANATATTAAARAEDARAVAVTRGNIATRAAAAVQWIWNAALAANPIGLVVAGVATLVAGIVALTYAMRGNTDEIERQSEAYGKLVADREMDEALTKQQIALARERGTATEEVTRMELDAARERRTALFEEHQAFLKIYYQKKKVTDDDIAKNREYFEQRKEVAKEIQLLEARLGKQEKDAAEQRAKEAQRRAEAARKERERLAKEKEAEIRQLEEAQIKELETYKDFRLAQIDADTDYANKSLQYTQSVAVERFNIEEAMQKSILALQKQFGRITQREYDAAILNLKASRNKFEQELKEARNAEQGSPQSIGVFDYDKAGLEKNLARIRKDASDKLVMLRSDLRADMEKDNSFDFFRDVLKLNEQETAGVKTALDSAKQALADYQAAVQRAADARVAASDRAVAAAENEYNRQTELSAAGLANRSQLARQELETAKKRQQEALENQRRVQRQQILLNAALEASNLAIAVSKVFKENGVLGIPLAAIMIGAFVATKAAAIRATKQEFATGGHGEIGGGTHASGRDTNLGFKTKSGKQAYAQRGELFGIVRHERARQYKPVWGAIVDSMNAGTFERQFASITRAGDEITNRYNVTDTRKMEGFLSSIDSSLKKGGGKGAPEMQQVGPGVFLIREGNWTRTEIRK